MKTLCRAVSRAEAMRACEAREDARFSEAYETLCREIETYLTARPGLSVRLSPYMGTCTFHVQVSTQSFALALHRLAARREVSLRVSSEGHRHTMRVRLKARRHDGWRIVSINHLRWRWLWRVWRVPVVEDFMVYLV